jgi:orotate phosphoribosyltransferase
LSDIAFRPVVDVTGWGVLLLDDVYTTGARSQSAASALTLAGALVVAIVVIARRVNPAYKPGVQALWDRQRAIPFSFTALPWWAA